MSLAKIIAQLVERGEEDLAEELLSTAAPVPPEAKKLQQDSVKLEKDLQKWMDRAKKIRDRAWKLGMKDFGHLAEVALRGVQRTHDEWPDFDRVDKFYEELGD